MAGGVGGLFSPWFIGRIFDNFNLMFAMNITYVFLFFLLASIIGLIVIDKKGVKNEKYFKSAYIEYLKNGVEVYLYIYIDNVLVTGGAITLSSSVLSGTKEILPPKSRSRRFTSIRYRIEGNDGVESQFRLKSFDIDVDPIKRRRGTSNG